MNKNDKNAAQTEKSRYTDKSPLIKLTGLWQGKTQNDETYYSAKILPNVKIMIMKNNFKGKTSEPDYNLYVSITPPASPSATVTQDFPDTPEINLIDFDFIDPDDIKL